MSAENHLFNLKYLFCCPFSCPIDSVARDGGKTGAPPSPLASYTLAKMRVLCDGSVHSRPRSRNRIFRHTKFAQRGFAQHAVITAPNPRVVQGITLRLFVLNNLYYN